MAIRPRGDAAADPEPAARGGVAYSESGTAVGGHGGDGAVGGVSGGKGGADGTATNGELWRLRRRPGVTGFQVSTLPPTHGVGRLMTCRRE